MYVMYVMYVRCVRFVTYLTYVARVLYVVYVMYVACALGRDAIAHRKIRIVDNSQVGVRPSSQRAHASRAQDHKLECDRHCTLGAHCNHRVTDAPHVAVTPQSQLARTLQAQNRQPIASCGATVIASRVHIAIPE